jgi:hypothetical protein
MPIREGGTEMDRIRARIHVVAGTDVTCVIGWRVVVAPVEALEFCYSFVGSGGPEWH